MEDINPINLQLPLPPIPDIGLLLLPPPTISDHSYTLFHERKHLAIINGQDEFSSSKEEVEKKCKKQLQSAQKNSTETQSTGVKQLRNLEICTKCQKCGHFIENAQLKSHMSFHAAPIIQGILLGDKICSMSKKELIQRNKVTHIVNAASQLKNYLEQQGVKYIKLDLYDDYQQQLIGEVSKASQFMKEAIDQGGVVFVHCAMGKSRSVSSIIMYLMQHKNMNYEDSLKLIRINRPIAKPNLSYERQLKEYYEKTLQQK